MIKCPICEKEHNIKKFKNRDKIACNCGYIIKFIKNKEEIVNDLKQTEVINSLSIKKQNLLALIKLCNMMVISYETEELLNSIINMSKSLLKVERSAIILVE